MAGALTDVEFHAYAAEAGFVDIEIEPTRIYDFEDARVFLGEAVFGLRGTRP